MSRNVSRANGLDQRDAKSGRFLTGSNGGPGRPRGSRNLLSEDFLRDLHKEWERSGNEPLARVARDFPHVFVKVVAGLLPRELHAELDMNLSVIAEARSYNEAYRFALRHIGSEIEPEDEPPLIEGGTDE